MTPGPYESSPDVRGHGGLRSGPQGHPRRIPRPVRAAKGVQLRILGDDPGSWCGPNAIPRDFTNGRQAGQRQEGTGRREQGQV